MANGRGPTYATAGALVGIAGLLGFIALQIQGIEERLIAQGRELRALGEATDRLSATGTRVANDHSGGVNPASSSEAEPEHVLHPDVTNLLKPRDKRWPAPGAPLDGTLTRGWSSGDPKGFNPLIENAAELSELIEVYVGTQLADRNFRNPDEWHGDLATRVEVTDDFKELTIYLRPGTFWHPATNLDLDAPKYAWLRGDHEMTSEDVVFTFDMMLNPQVENGFLKNYYSEFESIKAVDKYTVVVRWKKKQYGNIDSTLSVQVLPKFIFAYGEDGSPIPKETLGARFNEHWYNNKGYVGAGPYRMASYEPGTRIRLLRYDRYPGDKPAIKEIDYPIYTDQNQTLLKLKAHELSTGGLTPGQYREEILQYKSANTKPAGSPFFDGRIECREVEQPAYRYVGWNADRPLFADKRVRRALGLAFNREEILKSVFVGLGVLITGPYLPSGPYNDPSLPQLPFDLEAAKKLLADAGFKDTDGDGLLDKELHPGDGKRVPLEFSLLIPSSSKEFASLANIYKDDLLKIGVKMSIDAAEWSLMQKRMDEKSFDAFTGGWALDWDSDLYQIWHSSQADIPKGSNHVGFRNAEADKIIETLRSTFDPAERVRLSHQLHRVIYDEQPYTFFMSPKGVACFWNDVKNVEFSRVRPVVNTLPWAVERGAN